MKTIALVSVIDDDKIFQYVMKKVIEASNRVDKIIQFEDGDQAIKYFLANKDNEESIPDLVFLDINMPFVDGWEFLDQFTQTTFKKELITIYISSSSQSSYDMDKYLTYPKLKGYLIKPVSKLEFERVLEEHLKAS